MGAFDGWRMVGAGGEVRTWSILGAVATLRDAGHDPEPVLASAELDAAALGDPEGLVPLRSAGRVLAETVRLTGLDDLGLRLGRGAHAGALGAVGEMIRRAPTVRDGLHVLLRSLAAGNRGSVPWMTVDGPQVSLGYAICEPGAEASEQLQDVAIAVGLNLLRDACGPDFSPLDVRLARRPPVRADAHRAHYGRTPAFNAPLSAIVFDARWLDRPMAGADPAPGDTDAWFARLLAEDRRTLPQRVRTAVRIALVHRNCSAERVARALSVGYRTLHRRLAEAGTTFQELVDSVRFDTAAKLLEQTDLPLGEIADALDYTDPSAFTRAFVRWTGTTPSAWRAAARRGAAVRGGVRRPHAPDAGRVFLPNFQ
jgi:AraC-like DNA-binding protein